MKFISCNTAICALHCVGVGVSSSPGFIWMCVAYCCFSLVQIVEEATGVVEEAQVVVIV